jgi:hypothetical protein
MNENDIARLQDLVRYWLLETERHDGEQAEKIQRLLQLIDRVEEYQTV